MASYKNFTQNKWKNLNDLSDNPNDTSKKNTSIKKFEDTLEDWADMLSYFRWYPDKFVEYLLPKDSKFQLYPFQRIYLRIMTRFRNVMIVATRGTSKSFLSILSDYLECIMYPNVKKSLIAPQKQQASSIAQQNIEALWHFIPLLRNEVKHFNFAKDMTRIVFHNNSSLDIVSATQSSRGLRKHSLTFEETVQMDDKREIIGEVLLPLLANSRIGANGKVDPHEIHKKIRHVTTASSRQSYAWEVLLSMMKDMAEGKSAFVIGNDYTLPVMFNQLDIEYINEVKEDPSISPLQFAREYMSVWTGSSENSLVQLKDLEKCRVLTNPEFKATKGDHKYIISVDVARSERSDSATTAIAIFKITPRGDGTYIKHLVHIHTYKGNMHFESQALYIKELVDKYNASMVVIDANGLGKGLVDYLVKEDKYPSYAVTNDDTYDKYRLPNSLPLIFNISANTKQTNASDMHNHFMTVIANHDLKLLVSEANAREKSKEKDYEKLAEQLLPHIETGLFVEEVMNLTFHAEGNKTKVQRISKQMDKDRYSAVSYGLWYIYLLERKNQQRKRQTFDITGFFAAKQPKYKVWD